MASNRIGRINDEIQRELAEQIRYLKDPRVSQVGMVSIIRVDTTGDLRYARVYVSVLDKNQEKVTGKVRLKLYKGNMINAGVWSDYSLYSEEIATFGESDYDQKDSAGFINLWGLPISVQAQVAAKNKKK